MTDPIIVILGAGEPFSGTDPSALTRTSGDRRLSAEHVVRVRDVRGSHERDEPSALCEPDGRDGPGGERFEPEGRGR